MDIRKFTMDDVAQARALALENYNEERSVNSVLPEITETPKLDYYVENELGVCAYEGEKLVGFLGCYNPWKGGYDTYDDLSIFVPCHAHAAVKENRVRIYQDMFAFAAENWVRKNIVGFGISMYAHDEDGKNAFFEYGFGMRCTDEIRPMAPFRAIQNKEMMFFELPLPGFPKVRELRKSLNAHLKQSPCFMQGTDEECDAWLQRVEAGDRRTFVACDEEKIIAYLDVADEGENFATEIKGFQNLQGAWCDPAYRGRGITDDLLEYVIETLALEGNTILGVDHETYNPTANRFWPKYFSRYTCSLTRHIETWSMK